MPEPRPMYSILLEDRRIIDAVNEAKESPSLVVHLLEKEWSIRPGHAPASPTAHKFSYSDNISSLLDDIQARRIPAEFIGLFKTLKVKMFEGCLLVEMHDARPSQEGSAKVTEPRNEFYVLRPTAETMWSDIRNVVDSQPGWGDKEALELEARLVLSTSTPLCLDPSPSVNRTANIIVRSGTYPSKMSFKRKQTEEDEDDEEIIKHRKLMQMMNPRAGKSFNPIYRALAAKRVVEERVKNPPQQATLDGFNPQQPNAPARPQPPPNQPTAIANGMTNGMPSHMAHLAAHSARQAQAIAVMQNQRLMNLKIPPDAAAAAAHLSQAQRQAHAQAQAQAQVQARLQLALAQQQSNAQTQMQAPAAAVAAANQMQAAAAQQNPPALNEQKMEVDDMAHQLTTLQNGQGAFSLTMPPKRTNQINPTASPPKPGSSAPDAPQITPHMPMANPNVPGIHQTPLQQHATLQNPQQTPMMASGQISVPQQQQPGPPIHNLSSYHQGLANGLQNQMNNVIQTQQNVQPNHPMMNNPYQNNPYQNSQMVAQAAQMANNMGALTAMQRQQFMYQFAQRQAAMQAAQAGMQMHPPQPQQHTGMIQQFGGMGNVQQGAPPNQQSQQFQLLQQQQRQLQLARLNQSINIQAEARLNAMSPEDVQNLLSTATEQHRSQPAWASMDDRARARALMAFQIRLELSRARQQQLVNQAAASNGMR